MSRPQEHLAQAVDEIIAEAIASRVAEKLRNEHLISGEIPVDVAESISFYAKGGAIYWVQSIPLAGANNIGAHYTLTPAGLLHIDLRRSNGETFWRGTLAYLP